MLRTMDTGKNVGLCSLKGDSVHGMHLDTFNLLFKVLKKDILLWTFHVSNKTGGVESFRLEGSFSWLNHSYGETNSDVVEMTLWLPNLISFSSSWAQRSVSSQPPLQWGQGHVTGFWTIAIRPPVFYHLFHILPPPSRAIFRDMYLPHLRWQHYKMEGAWDA